MPLTRTSTVAETTAVQPEITRRAYLYFVLTFVLGIVVGGGGLFFYALETGAWHRPYSRERVVKGLIRDVGLSPAQTTQLQIILEESGKQRHIVEDQMNRQFDELREQARNRIRQMLNPEQLIKFNEIAHRHDEERRRMKRP
jgi:hypothetical protein